MDLQSGNFGFTHSLATNPLKGDSGISLNNKRWYHLHKQVNQDDGLVELFIDGSLAVSKSFDQDDASANDIESEWIIGSGTISSSVDEIRISATNRSVIGFWQAMKIKNCLHHSHPKANSLTGPPSFTSDRDFTIYSGETFNHMADATGEPVAYVANGLPAGLLLESLERQSFWCSHNGWNFCPTLRAVYADGSSALENYNFNVLASPPQISISVPQAD